MIESALIAAVIISIVFSFLSFCLAVWNTIEIQASKRSTHSVIPIGANSSPLDDLEKKLSDITKGAGSDQGDLNRGLFEAGLDPEELV